MPVLTDPIKIVEKSFSIINNYLKSTAFTARQKNVVRRIIHATSDPRYAKDLLFHRNAVEKGIEAIKKGKDIIVDAEMVKAGINKKILSNFGGRVICLINSSAVAQKAARLKLTRAMLGMRELQDMANGRIIAIGNAPTALFELCNLIEQEKAMPALVVGLPVGFVGAKEAKRKLSTLNLPYITNRSRRGGSSAAAAAINALLEMAKEGR